MLSPELQTGAVDPSVAEFFEDETLHEHCGVWAVWDPANKDRDLISEAYVGLQGIQHRGQDGAGVAVYSPSEPRLQHVTGPGKVKDFLMNQSPELALLPSDATAANAHTSWNTDKFGKRLQPIEVTGDGVELSLSHNGQIRNQLQLAAEFGIDDYKIDSELVAKIIHKVAVTEHKGDVERALMKVLPLLDGAFCFTILTPDKLYAIRDRHGIRPLGIGRTPSGGYAVSSEKKAITDVSGYNWEREIQSGEMVVMTTGGVRSGQWTTDIRPATCALEFIYMSNKENIINGREVADYRHELGALLAKKIHPAVTLLVASPNSANQLVHGMHEASGIPEPAEPALVKIDPERSFINPDEVSQEEAAAGKTVDRAAIEGEYVGLGDDSHIKGTTQKAEAKLLRDNGAVEVHGLIGSAPFVDSCEWGAAIPERARLAAAKHDGDFKAMAKEADLDSLVFLTLEEMQQVIGKNACTACMGGDTPSPIDWAEEIAQQNRLPLELVGSSA